TLILGYYVLRDVNFESISTELLAMARVLKIANAEIFLFRSFINSYLGVRDSTSRVEPLAYLNWSNSKTGSSSLQLADTVLSNGVLIVRYVTKGSGAEQA